MRLDIAWELLVFLAFAAMAAGFVDSVAGGGGLLQVPALFGSLPQASTASLFGTNKFSSIAGTAWATWRYTRHVRIDWRVGFPAVVAAGIFSWLGASAVSLLSREAAQPLVLVLLVLVAYATLRDRGLGREHAPTLSNKGAFGAALLLGAGIGFYDGFFGPGTGAFLIFVFVRSFGFDFLHASAHAKLVNATTNIGALLYFIPSGEILWLLAVVMAISNVFGATLGTMLAIRKGSAFVRQFFLVLLAVLILRMAWTTWEMFL